jgi:hypothetical protein
LLAAVAAGLAGLGWCGGLGPALSAPPAGAVPAVNCSTGVIVAADFSPWGGDINSVCDATVPATAADALVATGFDPTGVAGYGLDFICQIAGDPPDDTCATTPPADAYWSFWYADAGRDTWTYSQSGAMDLEPTTGSVEAWVFGGDSGASPPSAFPSPNSIRAATVRTSTTTTSTQPASSPTPASTVTTLAGAAPVPPHATASSPPTGDGAGTSGHPSNAVAVTGPSPVKTEGGAAPTTEPTRPTTKTAPRSARGPHTGTRAGHDAGREPPAPKIVDAAPALATQSSSGSPLPFLIGAGAVVALAATGGLIAWRRRRTD